MKYHNTLADAVADIGQPDEISKGFAGFQQYLYPPSIAAIESAGGWPIK